MKTGDSLVLDSCAVIAHFKGEVSVKACLEQAAALYLPLTAYGELHYGALKAPRQAHHLAELQTFLQSATLFYPTAETARAYAEIRLTLAHKGQPIPENDIWIAAVARQLGLPLVTRDSHFARIDGLQLIAL